MNILHVEYYEIFCKWVQHPILHTNNTITNEPKTQYDKAMYRTRHSHSHIVASPEWFTCVAQSNLLRQRNNSIRVVSDVQHHMNLH